MLFVRNGDELNPRHPQRLQVFYSAAAQEDNLGDVVIRKAVLEWIAEASDDVHVFRGNMSDSYIAALEAPCGVTVHDSPKSFARAWLRSCVRRQAALVFAPGPRTATRSVASAKSAAQMVAMTAITRLSGGPVLAIGGALRGVPSAALRLHRLVASMCSDYSVRDPLSQSLLKGKVRVIPDVAFAGAEPRVVDPDEPVLAISLRFDRPTNLPTLRALVDSAKASGIEPIFVTQVRRDQGNHQLLAQELGAELCGWTDESHLEQLARIEQIYCRSLVVYSDRLHACILGGKYGAIIINAESTTSDKIRSTLPVVYDADALITQDTAVDQILETSRHFTRLSAKQNLTSAHVRAAVQALSVARSGYTDYLRHGHKPLTDTTADAVQQRPKTLTLARSFSAAEKESS